MAITVGNYTAEGPYTNTGALKDASGVYIVLTRANANSQWTVVDIGESHAVKTRVENHDRASCWQGRTQGTLAVAVIYTPNKQQSGRKLIEQELRQRFSPPCGDR